MTGHVDSPRQLLEALGKAVSEGRIAVWSSSPDEQNVIETTPLAHIIPDDSAPYAAVVINNIAGNKLDYYLTRQIDYIAGACDSDTRKSEVTVRLVNNVPDQPLPDYVAGTSGLINFQVEVPRNSNITSVSLLATKGAMLSGVFVNGVKTRAFGGVERGHPIYQVQLALLPGQPVVVRWDLSEPTTPGAPRVPIQPLRDEVSPAVSVPECSG
jgi:hypothetical protein